MSFIKEFKEFAIKGNVIDLAVGIIVGAAFGKIVSSLVADIIMPPIGLIIGGVNFSDLVFTLKSAQGNSPAVVIAYGRFIQTILDFIIIAFAIFGLVKILNKIKPKEEKAEVLTKQETLLTEIRDLLREKNKSS